MRLRRLFGRRASGDEAFDLLARTTFGHAEVNRYEERLFVTAGWGSAWGAAVPQGASPSEIGVLVKEGLDASRRDSPLLVLDGRGLVGSRAKQKDEWERFCRDVAGVPVIRYRPEIRIDVRDLNDGVLRLRPLDRRDDETTEESLPAEADPTAIGDVVARFLAETPPRWATSRRATLATEANGRLVIHSHNAVFAIGPVQVLPADADESILGAAIRVALNASRLEETSPGEFGDALQAAGIEEKDLAGGAQVGIEKTTRGELFIEGWKPDGAGWTPADLPQTTIDDRDLETAARMARALLDQIPTRHRKPATRTGTAFGYEMTWLAICDAQTAAVVEALGLTGRRSLPWEDGVNEAFRAGVFVTPPTRGWVLALGAGFFPRKPDVAALSARLDAEVQLFATHRIVEAHSWELGRAGAVIRRVSYVGESGTVEESGEATEVEERLGLVALSAEAAGELISEETVMQVADSWSLDPRQLETTPTAGSTGIHGQLPRA